MATHQVTPNMSKRGHWQPLALFLSGMLLLTGCNASEKNQANSPTEVVPNKPPTNDTTAPTKVPVEPQVTPEVLPHVPPQGQVDPERRDWQNPDLVIDKLGSLQGKVVADIGAGTGYFTFRLANIAQKVIATDIEPTLINYLGQRKSELNSGQRNKIELRLVKPAQTGLQSNEADAVLMVNTYSFLTNRGQYLINLLGGIKKGGKLVVVDYKYEQSKLGPPLTARTPLIIVSNELAAAGFTSIQPDSVSLAYQYIITATK